jgi:hypothetical protein
MWTIAPQDQYTARLRKWGKRYKRELAAMRSNLDTLLRALQAGQRLPSVLAMFGFIHP